MILESHILHPFMATGVLSPAEFHLVESVTRLQPDTDRLSLLALAVAARGTSLGHACIHLQENSEFEALLTESSGPEQSNSPLPPWPEADEWLAALRESQIVASPDTYLQEPLRPLVLDGDRVYLQRYFSHEVKVAAEITRRVAINKPQQGVHHILDGLFGADPEGSNAQRRAAETALGSGLTIVTGGPGTGKTYTIARILAAATQLAHRAGSTIAVALAAPTGKAAARITESVAKAATDLPTPPTATTIHALLGWAPGDEFRHNRSNPLPHDLVIIDETSMLSLSLMARLLDAVRPDAGLVLVGDHDQLASVEVGTVLSDIVGPADADHDGSILGSKIVRLTRVHRFGEESPIASLAAAVQAGDSAAALRLLANTAEQTQGDPPAVDRGRPNQPDAIMKAQPDQPAAIKKAQSDHRVAIEWVRPDHRVEIERVIGEVVDTSVSVAVSALAGDADAALATSLHTKVLAATRMSQYGLYHWSDIIESSVVARVPRIDNSRRWFVGRPVMITATDRINRLANGDTGIVVDRRGALAVAMAGGDPAGNNAVRYLATSRLSEVESWWAMTIHKSQGSEFRHVVVSLPPAGSPILTRELLYTAITRASERVTIVATESALAEAIGRGVSRASGLAARLWLDNGGATG